MNILLNMVLPRLLYAIKQTVSTYIVGENAMMAHFNLLLIALIDHIAILISILRRN